MANTPRILHIEDNPGDALIFKEIIAENKTPAEVIHFDTGTKALNYLNDLDSHGEYSLPHLGLFDYHLPDMDVLPLIQFVRSSKRFPKMPIVVFSGADTSEHVTKAYRNQIDSFIVKPAFVKDYAEVIRKIDQVLRKTMGHESSPHF